MSEIDWKALEKAAIEARSHAYSPYSKYRVGAALLADDGQIFVGCNVENASYGLTVCAERNAVGTMIATGPRKIMAVAVVTAGKEAGSPCGMCRQVLAEFTDDAPVHMLSVDENDRELDRRVSSVNELLPGKFRGDMVTKNTES